MSSVSAAVMILKKWKPRDVDFLQMSRIDSIFFLYLLCIITSVWWTCLFKQRTWIDSPPQWMHTWGGGKLSLTPIFSYHLHGVGAVLLSVQSLDRLELSWVLPNGEIFLSVSSQWIPEERTAFESHILFHNQAIITLWIIMKKNKKSFSKTIYKELH